MKRKVIQAACRLLLLVLVFAVPAYAANKASLPIVENNGQFSCPTCSTEASPTNHGIPVWSTTQELGVIGPDASSTKVLCSNGSSSDPSFCSLSLSFLPSDTANNWAAKIGTPTGAGEFVRATNPTFAGATFGAGTVDFSAATVTGLTSSFVARLDVSPMTSLTVLSATPVYCGLDGSCSTATDGTDVQTRLAGTGSFAGLECDSPDGTTNAVTAVVGVGTCGSAPNVTSKAQNIMSASAWTRGTASGTTSWTDGQCVVIRYSAGTNATKAVYRCSVRQTAGS